MLEFIESRHLPSLAASLAVLGLWVFPVGHAVSLEDATQSTSATEISEDDIVQACRPDDPEFVEAKLKLQGIGHRIEALSPADDPTAEFEALKELSEFCGRYVAGAASDARLPLDRERKRQLVPSFENLLGVYD